MRRLILIPVLLLCIVFSGCQMLLPEEEQKFIGTWDNSTYLVPSLPDYGKTIITYKFNADKSGEFGSVMEYGSQYIPMKTEFNWRLENGKVYTIYKITGIGEVFSYTFNSPTELTLHGLNTMTYTKVQ